MPWKETKFPCGSVYREFTGTPTRKDELEFYVKRRKTKSVAPPLKERELKE